MKQPRHDRGGNEHVMKTYLCRTRYRVRGEQRTSLRDEKPRSLGSETLVCCNTARGCHQRWQRSS